MVIPYSAQTVACLVLTKDARLGPSLDNLRLDPTREFWMTLNGDKAARRIHALDRTARRGSEKRHIRRTVKDHVLVHLLDALQRVRLSAHLCIRAVWASACNKHLRSFPIRRIVCPSLSGPCHRRQFPSLGRSVRPLRLVRDRRSGGQNISRANGPDPGQGLAA